jgi:cystathionine beta-lyase/cystathionine gamma-synthase
MSQQYTHLETQLVHAGEPSPRIAGAVEMPIFQSATYEYAGESSYDDVRYLRMNNTPSQQALHAKLAVLEGAEDALVTASGMAAISGTLLGLLASGDHVLAQRGLYGGTHELLTQEFPSLGITTTPIDADCPAGWAAQLTPRTRLIYVEAMTNPLLEVGDLGAVAAFAREHGLVAVIDNTFASPVNFRPLAHGFHLSIHSASKYLNGHTDIVAGAVSGSRELIGRICHRLNVLGGSLDPHAAFLLKRGMKTLALRVRYQNDSTLRIAQFLEAHAAVARVNYPGLPSHPRHERARRLFAGCGGVLSFELKGGAAVVDRFMARLRIPALAPSLGGVHTLITRPALTSHAAVPAAERRQLGISDGLVRLSVGIEATEELIADLAGALR